MISKRIYAAWFGIHFLLITAVCVAGLFSLIAEDATVLPSAFNQYARKAELAAAWLLGKQAGESNPFRRFPIRLNRIDEQTKAQAILARAPKD